MTFRTFASPEVVFDLLVERYQMDHPASLSIEEFEEWKEKKLRPTQNRVLTILTMWLEDYNLLDEEPWMAKSLADFLKLVVTPAAQASIAKLILQSLERLVRFDCFGCLSLIYVWHRLPLAPDQGLNHNLRLSGKKIRRTGMIS